ncbi:Transcription elongation factor S-II [Ceratocystis fimbriata CBS 114723]|uniref:Transcription elongation factor n=3 Tax=Ceratocystis TaxID=5157 RepID=A0A2C5XH20_9PEZI|nr:Transcription elongation factor S-II [Ceratocystis fimbriata CBS 114723]
MAAKTMELRDLEQQMKSLQKALQDKEPPSVTITILEKLAKERPTEDMLRTTRAGVFIAKLRGNPNREIATAASETVNKWKSLVSSSKSKKSDIRSKAAAASAAGSSASSATGTPHNATSASAAKPAVASIHQPFKGDTEKRRFDADGAVINLTQSEVRNRCIGLLYNGLAYRSKESVARVTEIAGQVEKAIFDSHGGESASYKNRVRSLFQNLKNKSNIELGRNVMSGVISTKDFATMSHEDMKSASQREIERKLEEENMKRAQAPMAEKSVSDAWKCSKCGERKTSYSQAQTRAADEPMTTFCECMACGHRWKFS